VDLSLRGELASRYPSRSQAGRVLSQDWVSRELGCLRCSSLPLHATPQNTPARDFECVQCHEYYELKSTSRKFGRRVADGEYETFRSAVDSDAGPSLLLMEYDLHALSVRSLRAVHRSLLSGRVVVPRRPLSPSARRAGWQGCYIDLGLIPESGLVPIITGGHPQQWGSVTTGWSRYEFMIQLHPESRGWILDVLECIHRLPSSHFSVEDVCAFEQDLAARHPANQNVRPKIRQQLQVLVAKGVLRRESRGKYSLTRPWMR